MHSDKFVEAAKILKMSIQQKRMDAATTMEMWDAAGVGTGSQRIINSCFKNHFGWRFTKTKRNVSESLLANNAVAPMFGTCMVEGKEQTFWCKEIDEVIDNRIELHLTSNPNFKYDSVDVVFGADHGQGSFQAVIKVILREDKKIVHTFECGVGEVECSKENSHCISCAVSLLHLVS